jgi:hypothetical protein
MLPARVPEVVEAADAPGVAFNHPAPARTRSYIPTRIGFERDQDQEHVQDRHQEEADH